MEATYVKYRRKQIAELADWQPGFDMTGVSISAVDAENGSPKYGDKIARNPADHNDRWLVASDYFMENFESIDEKPVECIPAVYPTTRDRVLISADNTFTVTEALEFVNKIMDALIILQP
jgi:dTDP-4-dehydrorhamnose 3,5-epimerase-like enzyme